MRTLQREKTFDLRIALRGIFYVVVCIAALLLLMEGVVVAVRFVVG